MPGSDGLRTWIFWKRRQLSLDYGPVELVVYWGPLQLVVEWGPVELVVHLGHVDGQLKLSPTMVLRSLGVDRWGIRLSFSGPDRRRWKEIWNSMRCTKGLSFVSIVWYERLLRIVSLSPLVEEPNSEVKKFINVRTWTIVLMYCVFEFLHVPLDWDIIVIMI